MCINKVINYGFHRTVKDKCLEFDIIVIFRTQIKHKEKSKIQHFEGCMRKILNYDSCDTQEIKYQKFDMKVRFKKQELATNGFSKIAI